MVVSVVASISNLGQKLRTDSSETNAENQSRSRGRHGSPTRHRRFRLLLPGSYPPCNIILHPINVSLFLRLSVRSATRCTRSLSASTATKSMRFPAAEVAWPTSCGNAGLANAKRTPSLNPLSQRNRTRRRTGSSSRS